MLEVLKYCLELNPRVWQHFERVFRARVQLLGMAKLGTPRTLFTAAAWCNIAKMIVIIDYFRYVIAVNHTSAALHQSVSSCILYQLVFVRQK